MNNFRKKFSQIYDQYVEKIYRFIYLKVNSEEIAQDLCSETFLRGWNAYQKNHNPKPEIKNIQAFLYQIARNLIIDHYREKGKREIVSAEQVSIIDPQPGLEIKMALNSDLEQVKAALIDMKEDYQNVVIWRYLDDLSISEIAKMLNRTEQATRVLLHRALNSLREKINQTNQS